MGQLAEPDSSSYRVDTHMVDKEFNRKAKSYDFNSFVRYNGIQSRYQIIPKKYVEMTAGSPIRAMVQPLRATGHSVNYFWLDQ